MFHLVKIDFQKYIFLFKDILNVFSDTTWEKQIVKYCKTKLKHGHLHIPGFLTVLWAGPTPLSVLFVETPPEGTQLFLGGFSREQIYISNCQNESTLHSWNRSTDTHLVWGYFLFLVFFFWMGFVLVGLFGFLFCIFGVV